MYTCSDVMGDFFITHVTYSFWVHRQCEANSNSNVTCVKKNHPICCEIFSCYAYLLYSYFMMQVVKFRPKDKDARLKFTECKKIVQKQAFEKAIAVDHEKKPLADTLDLNAIGKNLYEMLM